MMPRKSGYLLGFAGAVVLLSVIASLEGEVAAARGGAEPAPVNRALKGDRMLPVRALAASGRWRRGRANPNCRTNAKPPFSTRNSVFSDEVAGRCIS